MAAVAHAVWDALSVGAGLFWKALWALVFGYAISAGIQVFLSRREAADHLGDGTPQQLGLAMGFGFASSACSFAALSATRSLWTKGAALVSALAFMFASSNLAIELGVLLWIFLGWQFSLALYLGAPLLVLVMALLVRATCPSELARQARERAQDVSGDGMEPSEGLPEGWRARLASGKAWHRIGDQFVAEWAMIWKELTAGFLAAGAVAALVPSSWFEAIFPQSLPVWLLVPVHALLAPVLAVFTVIGSMGNGPLAAILWQNGIVFGGIMAFLYSDYVVPPSLRINARYYGWRFALYLGAILAAAAVVTGVVVHAIFSVLGLIPSEAKDVTEIATFAVDYTLFLNLAALALAGGLVVVSRR